MPAAAGVTRGTFPSTSRAAYGDAASKRIVDPEKMWYNIKAEFARHITVSARMTQSVILRRAPDADARYYINP